MSHLRRPARSGPNGFTLLELVIVLVLVVLLMAVAWPSLRRPLQRSTVQQAATQLAEDIGRARFNAIQTGRTMALRYELDGARYWIGPADEMSGDGELTDSSVELLEEDTSQSADEELPPFELVVGGVLDNGAVFQDPATIEDESDFPLGSTLSATLADEMAETEEVEPLIQDEGEDVNWSFPVLIYPTGRAENATILLASPDGYSIAITLRGLTGALTIGEVERTSRDTEGALSDSDIRPRPDSDLSNQGIFE